jgi:hypothetical protein
MPRNAIDASTNCASAAGCFRSSGIDIAIRYYSESHRAKTLKRPEAMALAQAGLKIGVVYQDRQNAAAFFSFSLGLRAGAFAYDYAVKEIRQPPGSAIYFAVDFDALPNEVKNNVIPYFEGVQKAFDTAGGGHPDYEVGVYGSGAVLTALTAAKLATRFWLCGSTGFRGFKDYLNSKKWHFRQFAPEAALCGIHVDFNDTNPDLPDNGAFQLDVDAEDVVTPVLNGSETMRVMARTGLRLRAGPGVEFDPIGLMPFGTVVRVVGRSGEWMMIDKNGDGASDGFSLGSFLSPA